MTARKTRRLDIAAALSKAESPKVASSITFGELCGAYCATVLSDADFRLRKWTEGMGTLSAWSITREMVQSVAEAMVEGGYKPSSVNRDVATVGSVFRWAKKKRMAPPGFRSPTSEFEWFVEPERVVHVSDQEIARLLAGSFTARDRRFAGFVHLLSDTGARRSEVLERRWKDVDLERRTITCPTTKTGRPRVLFFTEKTKELMLRTWIRRDPEALLFEGRLPGVPVNFRSAWLALAKAIGRPDLHVHDLRHVAAQRLLKGGVTVGVASQILGHSSNILQRRYGHLETATLQEAAMSVIGK